MAELLYQGHASFRITSESNVVMYVDPFAGEGYDVPADIVLVSHRHHDHDLIHLVNKKAECTVITNAEAHDGGSYDKFLINGIEIEAVQAYNTNHNADECVGYIVVVDGKKLYFAGDTSQTEQMKTFAERQLDYAFLPCDGVYNMGLSEASECAALINAKRSVPIHMKPGSLFERETAEKFIAPDRLIIEAGETITL